MASPRQASGNLISRSGRILLHTIRAFVSDNVSRLGAALAFYTTIAVAPLLVLAIAIAGAVFTEADARDKVLVEIERLAGSKAKEAVEDIASPDEQEGGRTATVVSAVTLAFGAFGVFYHLQDALNAIWRVPAGPKLTWIGAMRKRLLSLAMVLSTGFVLIVSLIASAALGWAGSRAVSAMGLPEKALESVNAALSFGLITLLFAVIFKLLPDLKIAWKHVWLGSAVTAFLFTLGKTALGLYLGRPSVTSSYGAAASLIVLLLWCYYAAQIFFFGAEFTRVTAATNGGRDLRSLQQKPI